MVRWTKPCWLSFFVFIVFSLLVLPSLVTAKNNIYEVYNSTLCPKHLKKIIKKTVDKKEATSIKRSNLNKTIKSIKSSKRDLKENIVFSKLDPTFKMGMVYCSKRNKGDYIIHAEVGIADSVEFKILDSNQTRVYKVSITGKPQVKNNAYTYEYVFTPFAPGEKYFFVMQANKDGNILTKSGECE